MNNIGLLINGELENTRETLDVVNPATEDIFTKVPRADEALLNKAVSSAKSAAASWGQTSLAERKALITKIADALHANIEPLAKALTQEQGKPLEAATMEVHYAEAFCRYFTALDLAPQVLSEDDNQRLELHRKPVGVVAGIIPWNFPILIAIYKLAPALLAGNSLIIKPAPTTPVTAVMLGEILKDVVPAGLVNIIVDNNDLGPKITSHPDVDKISFTGSTPTGKAIMASAASTLKRITLELGGNDAAIVLDDVDVKAAAQGIFATAFINSGQVCIALKRLYVHESIYDELSEEVANLARQAVVGNGLDEGTQFGPVQNKMQYDKVCGYIETAKADGTIIAGGDVSNDKGFFVPLTVVKDITDGSKVVDEEPFGPILPIIKYSDVDDAISRANNSDFGLGGSVWSSNIERASTVANAMQCGTVWINQHCAFAPNIPFPATKQSGIGVEFAQEGLNEFTNMQVVNINKAS
tara:strand:- start:5023 stop:6432 length:1410 start_codon:yes stop_codon:yes gene_type:complete